VCRFYAKIQNFRNLPAQLFALPLVGGSYLNYSQEGVVG